MTARRKFWGWGREDQVLSGPERAMLAAAYGARFGALPEAVPDPREEEFDLPKPRFSPPAALAPIVTDSRYERLLHATGKSFPDCARMYARQISCAPDLVAYPRSEEDLERLFAFAASARAALIPFGGGSSVVGGVEADVGPGFDGAITVDLARFDRVLEIDRASRAARIQAGVFGPALEAQLKPHGLTLRHFPQSFEFSTLGGWIATRSGGHYATLFTHIDDFVQGVRMLTPAGVYETRRLPGSGAGPDPARLAIGSEGILGVITEAWMRLQDTPRFRAAASVRFADFLTGAAAVRALSQSGLHPSNCRLIDANEARNTLAGDGSAALLVLAFESADHPQDAKLARALELCADHGGAFDPPAASSGAAHREGASGVWRNAFLRAPFFREALVAHGVIVDTFETAITWDRFPAFHAGVRERMLSVLQEATGRQGEITCRFTHVYPDGPAPYFTFTALGMPDALVAQWRTIKAAANEIVVALGGTVTHHHAVGRDHRSGYDRERPDLFAKALAAAKGALDPRGVMNPGVLIGPATGVMA